MLAVPETKSLIAVLETAGVQGNEEMQKSVGESLRASAMELWNALKEIDEPSRKGQSLLVSSSIAFEQIWEQVKYQNESPALSSESDVDEADGESLLSYSEVQSVSEDEKIDSYKENDYEQMLNLMKKVEKNGKRQKKEKEQDYHDLSMDDKVQGEERNQKYSESDWHLKGEASALQRPKDSLLSHNFEMDYALKNPPKPSSESTEALEERLKDRIKNRTFDDPKRNQIYSQPGDLLYSHKKDDEDSKRSTKSLVEIYDKTMQSVQSSDAKVSQEAQEELKCLTMWRTVLGYLDSLSSRKSVTQPFIENTFDSMKNSATLNKTEENDRHSALSKSSFTSREEMSSFEKRKSRKKEKNVRKPSRR